MLTLFSRPLGMDPVQRAALFDEQMYTQASFAEGINRGARPETLQRLAIRIALLDAELRTN